MNVKYIPVLSAEQMKLCDSYTIEELNIPSQVLMERAAHRVCDVLTAHERFDLSNALILAGSGNNGGDGIAVARFLKDAGYLPVVCFTGTDIGRASVECKRQYELAIQAGIKFLPSDDVISNIDEFSCVIDAIFGIGLTRDVAGVIADIINAVNSSGKAVLSVDVPSGIDADSGKICGVAIKADATVCIQSLKSGLLLFPAAEYTGEISVADIEIDLTPAYGHEAMKIIDDSFIGDIMARNKRSNKGSFGRVLSVCGSRGMSGAAYLCASAALRCGIGLAHIFTHESNRVIIQSMLPEAIVSTYEADFVPQLNCALSSADCAVVGCGLGKDATAFGILQRILNFEESKALLVDADALNLMAENSQLYLTRRFADKHITVFTPHPTEFARLTRNKVSVILSDLPFYAKKFAAERGVWVVLKDAHTVIASPSGECYINPYANSGMAKGGSGDTLAGIIGAVLTKLPYGADDETVSAYIAAAVRLHSLAGEDARARLGEVSMLPSNVIDSIATVTKSFSDTRTKISCI